MYDINQNMTIVLLVVGALGSFGGYGGGFPGTGSISSSGSETLDPAVLAIIITVVTVFVILALVAGGFIYTIYSGIAAHVAWSTAQNKTVTFEESFKIVIKKFWRIFFINFIVFWKVFGGFLLFVIPGVRAALRYQMVLMPVFESDADHKQAIATSKAITKGHLLEIFGLATAGVIIPLIGEALKIGGQSIMYPQLRHLQQSGAAAPKVHWLNYLGFFIIGGVFLLFLLIAIIAVIAISAT